jgi:lipoprotein-anchoring transpeptidase ErfK/SrfK
LAAAVVSAGIVFLSIAQSAAAAVVIEIDKSAQRMSVQVDGAQQYNWRVSTGLGGGPPAGTYRPQRLERHWFSRKFGMSPMSHSIFFHGGYAIHGTVYVSRLGHHASHGCCGRIPRTPRRCSRWFARKVSRTRAS